VTAMESSWWRIIKRLDWSAQWAPWASAGRYLAAPENSPTGRCEQATRQAYCHKPLTEYWMIRNTSGASFFRTVLSCVKVSVVLRLF
jgi:hypothetical protein